MTIGAQPLAGFSLAFIGGGFGGGELLLVLLAVLLLFGAKRLPELARSLGRALGELRRAAADVQNEILVADQPPPKPVPPVLLKDLDADAVSADTESRASEQATRPTD